MSVSIIASIPQVRVLGRHIANQHPLTLFYTAAGIECLFTGSELWLQLNADYNQVEPWVSVELNGAWISRFPVNKGESEICCFRGMTPGTQKHIRVLKDVRAMNDDPNHLLQITGLRYGDGGFLPLPDFTPETLGGKRASRQSLSQTGRRSANRVFTERSKVNIKTKNGRQTT